MVPAGVGTSSSQRKRLLQVASRNADRLARLVGDLIVMGDSDAGRLMPSPGEVPG